MTHPLSQRLDVLLEIDFAATTHPADTAQNWLEEVHAHLGSVSTPVKGLSPQMHGLSKSLGPSGVARALDGVVGVNPLLGCQHAHVLMGWTQHWQAAGSNEDVLRMWVASLAQTARALPHLSGAPIQQKHLKKQAVHMSQGVVAWVNQAQPDASLQKRCKTFESAVIEAILPSPQWPDPIVLGWGKTLVSAAAYLEQISFGSLAESRKTAWNVCAARLAWRLLEHGANLIARHDPKMTVVSLGVLFQLETLNAWRQRIAPPSVDFLMHRPSDVSLWETWGALLDTMPVPDNALGEVWHGLEEEDIRASLMESPLFDCLSSRAGAVGPLLRQKMLSEALPSQAPGSSPKPRM